MTEDPSTWSQGTWVLAVGAAVGGGLVNWYAKVKQGHARVFNFVELIGEIFVAGFVGITVFMGLAGVGQSEGVCAFSAGISGHMGTRLLFLIEHAAETHLRRAVKEKENAKV